MALQASREIIDLLKAQSDEINRLRDGMKELAESLGAGHLECRDKIMALRNPPLCNCGNAMMHFAGCPAYKAAIHV